MKLLRTIRLDTSDTFAFDRAAEPGEWAVPGTFAFANLDVAGLTGKQRVAFRSGWLGIDSLGWSTLVAVAEAAQEDRAAAVALLGRRLMERFGAPDIATATAAAQEEFAFAESLSDHPDGTVIALTRKHENADIRELFRTLAPGNRTQPNRAFTITEDPDPEEAPVEEFDLRALAKGERP